MSSERIILSKEDGNNLLWGDNNVYEVVDSRYEFIDQGRWTTTFNALVREKGSENYYFLNHTDGSTEMQENDPFEYDDPVLVPVTKKFVEMYVIE